MPQPLFAFEVGKSQLKAFSGAVGALADVGKELEPLRQVGAAVWVSVFLGGGSLRAAP